MEVTREPSQTMSSTSKPPKKTELSHLLQRINEKFYQNPYPSITERKQVLEKLKQLILSSEEQILDAIDKDFGGRCKEETLFGEILPVISGINLTKKHLKKWSRPSKRSLGILFWPAKAEVIYQPVGTVGIMVPWNYPILLSLSPLVSALSAGNRALIKMSEHTPHLGALLETLFKNSDLNTWVRVINGEADISKAFSQLPFDHLIFTGSTTVGKLVMAEAAKNLTPVTLELGGKSPVVIAKDYPISTAAERIFFGKAYNSGQTCVAPDYIFCHESKMEEFTSELKKTAKTHYPQGIETDDWTSIINNGQLERLQGYLKEAHHKNIKVIPIIDQKEEQSEKDQKKMPLFVLLPAKEQLKVMDDEIFGPILPVISYENMEECWSFIQSRPRPLALYLFDNDSKNIKKIKRTTHSGALSINECILHGAQDQLPFGGIGDSGMGHYHGKEGFLTFSKAKSILTKGRLNPTRLAYPPYGRFFHKLIKKIFIR